MEIKPILINPHYCSQEEYQELIDYLESQTWGYRIVNPKEIIEVPER